ncbi:MAG: ABC transporter substrate-binding protein [Treponema sp.]|jgi:peptide/nickel transport system substrate-binding protein|nr:ABC transporter substrate-binding protein [Treponema sp.]
MAFNSIVEASFFHYIKVTMNIKKPGVLFALIASILTAAAVFSAASCKGSAKGSAGLKELRFGLMSEPASLDPLSPSNTADGRLILFNVYEGLVKPDTSGRLVPAVAESYEMNQGGLVYSFTLREGLLFHDNSPLDAEDVAFTLNEAVKAAFTGFDRIESVRHFGKRQIEITLKTPDPDFLPNLTLGIVPKNNPDREKTPIGSGPFFIENYLPQQSLTLVKNPHYRISGMPKLDRVTAVFSASYDALYTGLEGGNINGAFVTGDVMEKLDKDKYEVTQSYSNSTQLLALNNSVKALGDARVRQAVNYAVDVQEIIDAAFYGRGEPSGSPLIPGLKLYYNEALRNPYPVDLSKALELMTDAGYANGFNLEIKIASNYVMHVDTGQVLVNQLAKIGINASIRLVDWATWLNDVYFGRNYEATIISLDSNTVSAPGFLSRYESNAGNNFINFKSEAYDKLYREILIEADEASRIRLYKEAQKIISDEAASVFIQDIYAFQVFKGGFKGAVSYPLYVIDFSAIYHE